MMRRKREYSVLVRRDISGGRADIIITAASKAEARKLAIREAEANTCLWFDKPDVSFEAEEVETT